MDTITPLELVRALRRLTYENLSSLCQLYFTTKPLAQPGQRVKGSDPILANDAYAKAITFDPATKTYTVDRNSERYASETNVPLSEIVTIIKSFVRLAPSPSTGYATLARYDKKQDIEYVVAVYSVRGIDCHRDEGGHLMGSLKGFLLLVFVLAAAFWFFFQGGTFNVRGAAGGGGGGLGPGPVFRRSALFK